jgi:hypothetical protein
MAVYTQSTEEYFQSLVTVSKYKMCKTRSGHVGLVPLSGVVGDRIYVLLGGGVFFVLRERGERPGMFRVIGGCYIHGMMKGKA